jgi:hypothetical protein
MPRAPKGFRAARIATLHLLNFAAGDIFTSNLLFYLRGCANRRVSGVSRQKVEGVGQQRQNGLERALRAGWAAGEIDDQRFSQASADGSAQRRKGRLPESFRTHSLGQSIDEAFADEPGGLRRDVAWGEAGASGGDDQLGGRSGSAQGGGNDLHLVGNYLGRHGGDPGPSQQIGHGCAGKVLPLAVEAAIADGYDDCPDIGAKSGVHRVSLRP